MATDHHKMNNEKNTGDLALKGMAILWVKVSVFYVETLLFELISNNRHFYLGTD